ncbi:hypothetical protein CHS0354_042147 [Potamilus streckersoni]|uniref:Uncharacterized protein n=1 Tax=Potamilus streckersoni TaxID=2493646 RepID=A0AAE0TNE6_9BIVA|nr:hypothetical protein CHS0354_042147 [Potamilus streckersoni]
MALEHRARTLLNEYDVSTEVRPTNPMNRLTFSQIWGQQNDLSEDEFDVDGDAQVFSTFREDSSLKFAEIDGSER